MNQRVVFYIYDKKKIKKAVLVNQENYFKIRFYLKKEYEANKNKLIRYVDKGILKRIPRYHIKNKIKDSNKINDIITSKKSISSALKVLRFSDQNI